MASAGRLRRWGLRPAGPGWGEEPARCSVHVILAQNGDSVGWDVVGLGRDAVIQIRSSSALAPSKMSARTTLQSAGTMAGAARTSTASPRLQDVARLTSCAKRVECARPERFGMDFFQRANGSTGWRSGIFKPIRVASGLDRIGANCTRGTERDCFLHPAAIARSAGSEACDTADLETCATGEGFDPDRPAKLFGGDRERRS